jgi:curved DNA-binding protein
MDFQDYYELLGVSKDASGADIKKAFRKLARKYHPDVAEDEDAAEEKFKQINEAYEVLGDPEKRQRYDQLGSNWDGRGGGGGGDGGGFDFGGTGFSDFFEAYFGGSGGGGMPGGRSPFGGMGGAPRARRGADIEGRIMVTLGEVNDGSVREISLTRPGGAPETLKVKVPQGVEDGQRLRVSGKGDPGAAGGSSGDLYLVITYSRHPEFEVEGADLVHELELPPHQLVLGTQVSVPTVGGRLKMKVPECSQPGDRLRVSGKGLVKSGGDHGDLYVELGAQFPESLTDDERELWGTFG